MTTEKTDLREEIHGYIDTAVETLTEEMDRQFGEVKARLDGMDGKLDALAQDMQSLKDYIKEKLP